MQKADMADVTEAGLERTAKRVAATLRTDEELMEALRSTLPREDGLVVAEPLTEPVGAVRWPENAIARVTTREGEHFLYKVVS